MNNIPTNYFLTGSIGTGKTTILNEVIKDLSQQEIRIDGFRTEAVVENGVVVGYCFCRLNEIQKIFAHIDYKTEQQFSNYNVTPSFFDETGTTSIKEALKNSDLIVMDEIGIMERKSYKFQSALLDCLNSEKIVLGIFQKRAKWFFDLINTRKDTLTFEVTVNNRANVHKKLLFHIKKNFC